MINIHFYIRLICISVVISSFAFIDYGSDSYHANAEAVTMGSCEDDPGNICDLQFEWVPDACNSRDDIYCEEQPE